MKETLLGYTLRDTIIPFSFTNPKCISVVERRCRHSKMIIKSIHSSLYYSLNNNKKKNTYICIHECTTEEKEKKIENRIE